MEKENWSYFFIGAIASFLISIYFIGVYDQGMYPGFRYLQMFFGVLCILLFVFALILRVASWKSSDEKVVKKDDKKYVASKDEKIYHKAGCSSAKKILKKNREYSSSTSKFRERGYEPCEFCMLK